MSIIAHIEQMKPSEIRIKKDGTQITFIVGGVPRTSQLTEKLFQVALTECSEYPLLAEASQTQDLFVFVYDWEKEIEVKKTQELISEVYKPLAEQNEDSNGLIARAIKYMEIHKSLGITLTSVGKAIIEGTVVDFEFNDEIIGEFHNTRTNLNHQVIGSIIDTIKIDNSTYTLSSARVGDVVTLQIQITVEDFSKFHIPMSNEMKNRLTNLEAGLIVCANNSIMGLEYMLGMLSNYDPNFLELVAQIGDTLVSTNIPTASNKEMLVQLKDSHYKYIIIEGKLLADVGMTKVFELILSGKTVIIGYDSNSIYSLVFNLKESLQNSKTSLADVLMNTVGFVYPYVSIMDNNELSLIETESVTLTTTRIGDISNNRVSRERFNNWIEHPALVYGLGSEGTFLTQEDEFNQLLKMSIDLGASDTHLAVGAKPKFRIQGVLQDVPKSNTLTPKMLEHICSVLVRSELHQSILEKEMDLYLPYSVTGLGRFRIQISTQRGTKAIVCRHTSSTIPSIEEARLPRPIVEAMLENPKGLIIVSGPTGSGKSTTSAILIDSLSSDAPYAITTLADPIEYLHSHKKGVVTQREIPSDVRSYESGLQSVLRSDPDVIEVQEMRSVESVAATLRFASSGHLVITTWHSSSVLGTITSLLNRVDPDRAQELRDILSQNLVAIINQTLVPGLDGNLYPIFEYLIPDSLARSYILDNKPKQFVGHMKSLAGAGRPSARYADYELVKAYMANLISEDTRDKYLRDASSLTEVIND